MKEHVTVIPADSIIIVNGLSYKCEFTVDEGVHALQWHNGAGELEVYENGIPSNVPITDYDEQVKPFVDIWQAKYDEINTPVVPTLEEAREAKLAELTSAFDTAAQNAHIMASVGFEIDANETANRNIEGLTLVMSDTDTTMFCDYNNEFHEVTKAQLETMRKEIVANSQRLYQVKWQYRAQIENAQSVAEIDVIVITF